VASYLEAYFLAAAVALTDVLVGLCASAEHWEIGLHPFESTGHRLGRCHSVAVHWGGPTDCKTAAFAEYLEDNPAAVDLAVRCSTSVALVAPAAAAGPDAAAVAAAAESCGPGNVVAGVGKRPGAVVAPAACAAVVASFGAAPFDAVVVGWVRTADTGQKRVQE
jgi:hypothetical protein